MDAFKLAFETVLVGALALPWLWLIGVLVNRRVSCLTRVLGKIVPPASVPATLGVAAFSFAYLLGSAISPVAQEFLDDMDSINLPTRSSIQARIIGGENGEDPQSEGAPRQATKATYIDASDKDGVVRLTSAIFHHNESTILLTSAEASERLNRLHERLTILTGATFSGFTLAMLLVFAWCGAWRSRLRVAARHLGLPRGIQVAAFLPCALIIFWGARNLILDWDKHSVDDPPVMELVLLTLGFFGFAVTARRRTAIAGLPGKLLFVAFLTFLSYGGYLSTEPAYVHEVMDSYAAMNTKPAPPIKRSNSAVTAFTLAENQGAELP